MNHHFSRILLFSRFVAFLKSNWLIGCQPITVGEKRWLFGPPWNPWNPLWKMGGDSMGKSRTEGFSSHVRFYLKNRFWTWDSISIDMFLLVFSRNWDSISTEWMYQQRRQDCPTPSLGQDSVAIVPTEAVLLNRNSWVLSLWRTPARKKYSEMFFDCSQEELPITSPRTLTLLPSGNLT